MSERAEPPDDLIATMIDLRGRTVLLTQERFEHVLNGHPEVRKPENIKKAVETAEKRTRGRYPDTEKLWARNIDGSRWFAVVVRYEGRVGNVRTALRERKGPREAELL